MNNCTFIVRIATDIDLRHSPTKQMAIATFTGAVDKRNSKKLKEEGKQSANFPRFKAFGKTAELINQYFTKGNLISLVCSFETSSYKNQDGATIYKNEFFVEKFDFLPNGKKEEQPKQDDDFSFGGFEDFQAIEDDDDVPF